MRHRLPPAGVLAGVAGSLLLALGAILLRDLPSTGASDLDVYAYFLDNRDTVQSGAAATLVGLALLVPFLTTIRIEQRTWGRGPRRRRCSRPGCSPSPQPPSPPP